jgi:hypothetical protein
MATLLPSCVTMQGGVTAGAGSGEDTLLTFGGSWTTGDLYNVVFTDSQTGVETTVGSGEVTGIQPSYVTTFGNRIHFVAGTTWYFSAINVPTVFNDPNGFGNGFINLTDFYASPQQTQAFAAYQGRLAVFARDNIQIWLTDPDPTQFTLVQTLENIGTNAPFSVQSIGDLDVFFLYDTGIRSLRVRDSSLNGFIVDIGSPIDAIIQQALLGLTPAQIASSPSTVDPSANRYWLFLTNTIYVLSYFPGSKIIAWSTYSPTYANGGVQTTFTPQFFFTFQGQVYCRTSDAFYLYGGASNNTFDNCVASWQTSYLPLKTPGNMKQFRSVGMAMTGSWQFSVSTDPMQGTSTLIFDSTGLANPNTYDSSRKSFSKRGSHVSFSAVTTDSSAAVFSGFNCSYDVQERR